MIPESISWGKGKQAGKKGWSPRKHTFPSLMLLGAKKKKKPICPGSRVHRPLCETAIWELSPRRHSDSGQLELISWAVTLQSLWPSVHRQQSCHGSLVKCWAGGRQVWYTAGPTGSTCSRLCCQSRLHEGVNLLLCGLTQEYALQWRCLHVSTQWVDKNKRKEPEEEVKKVMNICSLEIKIGSEGAFLSPKSMLF